MAQPLQKSTAPDCNLPESKKSDGIYPKRIRLSLDKACKVYNNYKQEIDIKQIKSRALLKPLINISHVWMNNGKFGIFWNILQIKHTLTILVS